MGLSSDDGTQDPFGEARRPGTGGGTSVGTVRSDPLLFRKQDPPTTVLGDLDSTTRPVPVRQGECLPGLRSSVGAPGRELKRTFFSLSAPAVEVVRVAQGSPDPGCPDPETSGAPGTVTHTGASDD